MRFGLLGPLEVVGAGGTPVDVGGRQARLVLAMLLAAGGRVVTPDAIAEELWGRTRPAAAAATLQSTVSRLRRRLASAAGATGRAPALVWDDPGYRLDVGGAEVDAARFEAMAAEGRAMLDAGRLAEARDVLCAADALWRGPALLEFADRDFATGLVTRLEERRLAALEDRVEADLGLGGHGAVAGELAELVARHPLRERLRGQLALALYRSGRQAEALRALDDTRRTLRDELGVEPSRPLRDLELAILGHDPALDLPAPSRAAVTGAGTGARPPAATPAPAPAPAGPVPATAPDGARTAPAAAPRRALIGRRAELAEVLAALDECTSDGRVVVVEGEPGIGKTRLAEELRDEATAGGAVVAWGRGYEGGAAPALWPWLAPLRDLADRAGGTDASLDALFGGEAAAGGGSAGAVRFERFEAVARYLERAAAAAPVVVVLDDLQWADEASLDLLAFLSVRLGRGVLLLVTLRRLEVGRNDALTDALAAVARRPGSRRLHLRGLTEADTVALLDALTGRPVPRDVAAAVHARSDGNPFYATELTRLVLEDEPDDADAVGRAGVPAGVGDVIRRRLAQLPEATRDLLSVAAVVGRDIELGLLARVVGVSTDALVDRLEPAVVHRLLLDVPEQPSTFRFCHALVREVLVDDLSSLRRARIHLWVADAIEAAGAGDDDAEVLAEHLWRAVPVGGGRRAADALERAAEVAVRRLAFAGAEQLLRRAVELRRSTASSPADEEAELVAMHRMLAIARARRYFSGAATPQLLERAKDLATRTGRTDLLIDVLWVEWSAATTSARLDDSRRLHARFADALAASPDPEVQMFAWVNRGVVAWQDGRIGDAVAHVDRAEALRAAASDAELTLDFADERQLLGLLFGRLYHALAGDDPDAGPALEALAATQRDGFVLTEVAGFATVVAEVTGDWDLAERLGRRIEAVDPDAQFSYYSAHALMGLGAAVVRRGDVEEGRRLFRDARARYLGVGGGSGLACHDAAIAVALAEAGRADDAVAAAEAARRTQDTLGEGWCEPLVLLAEGTAAHAAGDAAGAAPHLAAAVEVATDQGAHGIAGRAAATAARLGVPLPA